MAVPAALPNETPATTSLSTPRAAGRMTIPTEDVRRFAALFAGYSKAYGTFAVRGTNAEGKAIGEPLTLRGEPTLELYRRHLEGTGPGLGIIPHRDDNSVVFGAIDCDDRNLDHAAMEAKVRKLGLPLVLCRSKSGGGHLYLFTSEPVPAAVMRDRLTACLPLLGLKADTEIFPKQTERLNETDLGNWINLPYYGVGQA